jgi:hypothetical protein
LPSHGLRKLPVRDGAGVFALARRSRASRRFGEVFAGEGERVMFRFAAHCHRFTEAFQRRGSFGNILAADIDFSKADRAVEEECK